MLIRWITASLLLVTVGVSPAWSRSPAAGAAAIQWSELPPLPDPHGLAGPLVGVSNGALIVAGGANFPDGPPWEGHAKLWHDAIYVLTSPDAAWQIAPTPLPRPLAYGVAITVGDSVIGIGGSDSQQHHADVFRLRWNGSDVQWEAFPALPRPLAYACGAELGGTLYVAGGTEHPAATEASGRLWSLDLTGAARGAEWRERPRWPGPARMLATAGAQGESLFLFGGVQLRRGASGDPERVHPYLTDAYRYTPGSGARDGVWQPIADLPAPRAASPGPAPRLGVAELLLIGGDSGRHAVELGDDHPGFSRELWSYQSRTDRWIARGQLPAAENSPANSEDRSSAAEDDPARHGAPDDSGVPLWPPVTTGVVRWEGQLVIPSGEARPGVRTRQVLAGALEPTASGFRLIDYGVLTLYLGALAAVGLSFGRRGRTEDFFLGGRRIPWWVAGLSIFGTQLSAITFLAIPAKTFADDWTYLPVNFGIPIAAVIAAAFFLPYFRRLNVTTAFEYLEYRFHRGVRLYASAAFVVFQMGRMAIVILLPALTLAAVTGIDVTTCILVMGLLSTLYTAVGGIEAVIWTDVLQVVVLVGGALVALAVAVAGTEHGFHGVLESAAAYDKLRVVDLTADWTGPALGVVLLGALFTNFVPYTSDQAVVQRYLTPPSEREAKWAIWTGGLMAIPATLLFFTIGTALFSFYQSHPERLGVLESGDQVLVWFLVHELPAGLSGLLVAAVFAAAMSSLDSSLNSVAAALTHDFYRVARPDATDDRCLRLARRLTLLLGLCATAAAVALSQMEVRSLWDALLSVIGLLGGTTAGLFALARFSRRANTPGAVIGAAASLLLLFWVSTSTALNNLLYAGIAVCSCYVVGAAASLLFAPPQVGGRELGQVEGSVQK